jgi:hypothetical protein
LLLLPALAYFLLPQEKVSKVATTVPAASHA